MADTTDATPTMQRTAERVSFASLTQNNLGTVRKLHSVLFPIRYSDKFYKEIVATEHEDFCKLIYLNDVPVGTICARLEKKEDGPWLYLMTMGVLAPYRSRKLGSQTLQHVIDAARSRKDSNKITRIYLHVQVSNVDARKFYERHGFKETSLAKDYYKKIEPHDAWVLELDLQTTA